MKNLLELKNDHTLVELNSDSQKYLKGGGWGSGRKSSGKGCPPPDIMLRKGFVDDMG